MNKISPKKIVGLIGTLSLIAVLSATIFLVRQTQEIRKEAAQEESGINLNIQPRDSAQKAGETFTATIYLENSTSETKEFRVAGLEIQFDPTVFTVKEISCNNEFPLTIVNRTEADRILLTCSRQGGEEPLSLAKDNMQVLGTVNLEVKNAAPEGETNLTLKRFNIPDANTSFNIAKEITDQSPTTFKYTIENGQIDTTTFSINLKKGANLISIPVNISKSPAEALSEIDKPYSKIFAFDGVTKEWQSFVVNLPSWINSLENIDNTMGIWIYTDQDSTLNFSADYQNEVNIHLYKGANLIGFPSKQAKQLQEALLSIQGKYTKVFEYDATNGSWNSYDSSLPEWANSLKEMKPGFGYWIYTTENCTLRIENN